jgi:hypothetical protein
MFEHMFDTWLMSVFLGELLERAGVTTLTGGTSMDGAVLPVPPALSDLFPRGGLPRGSITVCRSSSLVLALVAQASGLAGGSTWCAEVGSPLLGSAAAAEAGIALDRFIRVAEPGRQWASVVTSLLDAFDLVVVHPPAGARQGDMRRLSARARERAAVLLVTGAWEGSALELSVSGQRWLGLGAGHGYLRTRQVQVCAVGRGAAARPRVATVWLPGLDGTVAPVCESAA